MFALYWPAATGDSAYCVPPPSLIRLWHLRHPWIEFCLITLFLQNLFSCLIFSVHFFLFFVIYCWLLAVFMAHSCEILCYMLVVKDQIYTNGSTTSPVCFCFLAFKILVTLLMGTTQIKIRIWKLLNLPLQQNFDDAFWLCLVAFKSITQIDLMQALYQKSQFLKAVILTLWARLTGKAVIGHGEYLHHLR